MLAAPHRALVSLLLAALPLTTVGCSVRVDKGNNGEDKKVKIDTPLGNIHVNTNNPAGSTGIALYPGAVAAPDHDGDKDADVRLGFGPWQLRVQVEHYSTGDDRDKVLAFYRKSLTRYGDVIECRGEQPVGQPEKTSEGLTCAESDKGAHVDMNSHEHGMTLRAGSKRHQHIVAFDKDDPGTAGPTKFALIALELPSENLKKDRETD